MNRAASLLGVAVTSWRLAHVSGPVSVSGTAVIPKDAPVAAVRLDGFLEAQNADGTIRTGKTAVAFIGVVDAAGVAAGWARPAIRVFVEQDGKLVGGSTLAGNVSLTSSASDGAVSVSGSGILSGDVLVRDR